MSRSLNKVMIIGHVGRDPATQALPSGLSVCSFSVATTEHKKEKEAVTEWHKIVTFGKLAEIAGQYILKGSQCYVEGKLQTRKWTDKSGNERYATEILATEILVLGNNHQKSESTKPAEARKEFYNDDVPF